MMTNCNLKATQIWNGDSRSWQRRWWRLYNKTALTVEGLQLN